MGNVRRWRLLALAAGLVAALAQSGCVPLPDARQAIAQSEAAETAVRIVGARGPLTARQSRLILARLERQNPHSTMLERHVTLEQALKGTPLIAGNKVRLLRDGDDAIAAIFAAIRGAKDTVNLEYFTFENVESGGERLGDLLLAKRRHGVRVNVIYDAFGSYDTADAFLDRLAKAGVNLIVYNPVFARHPHGDYSLNERDHRKILVVDGRMAIIGGINLSTVYQNPRPANPGTQPVCNTSKAYWLDTDIRIEGPAVTQLQKLFFATWSAQGGPALSGGSYFPQLAAKDAELVRILGSAPEEDMPAFYVTLVSAIRNAERRIWVTAGYFVPTHEEREDLAAAARRGVDVRLLLPGFSDSDFALAAGRSYYDDLLEAGVKIYERRDVVVHSKTIVIDGVWSAVGSSNFDNRSVLFNQEVDAVILGNDTAAQLEAMFRDNIAPARRIDLAAWRARPLAERVHELFARLGEELL